MHTKQRQIGSKYAMHPIELNIYKNWITGPLGDTPRRKMAALPNFYNIKLNRMPSILQPVLMIISILFLASTTWIQKFDLWMISLTSDSTECVS